MLLHLREKKDVGFFMSVAGLMQQCSVLDLDAFERCNKAEGLGVADGGSPQVKNLNDEAHIIKLFRFLQLLCEGHNLGKDVMDLTDLPLGKMATISLTIFSHAFSWIKSFVFWLNCHWSLFLRVQ